MHDLYSPVLHATEVRLLLALAAANHMALFTADIKQAFKFLYSPLAQDEKVYVIPPPELGFPPGSVWELYRALYGLKVGS
jgi:hypothetical protein